MDRLVVATAARQHNVIGHTELLGLGLGCDAVARRRRSGWLTELFPGAYYVGRGNVTRRSLWEAAVVSAGAMAVLSHRSAAQLWRLIPLIAGPPHLTVPHGRTLRRPGILIHRSRDLPASQITERYGIAVTTLERTLLDFASIASPAELRDAVWAAARRESFDLPRAVHLCREARGRRGSGRLANLLIERRGPVTETCSPLEDMFLPICAEFAIRMPAVNVPVLDYVVDCLWLPEQLVVELDGFDSHRSRESFESDRRRDIKLEAAGFPVLRLTDRRLRTERADVAADLLAMLERLGGGRTGVGGLSLP